MPDVHCKICHTEFRDSNPEWKVLVLKKFEYEENQFKRGKTLFPVCRGCALDRFRSGTLKNLSAPAYGDYIAGGRNVERGKLGHCLALK